VEPRELERCFPEFAPLREGCRFRGCTHLHEPDCAVREALEEGEIDAGRFASYRALHRETAAE
jgi:ribosome biogenesis GTPase